VTDSPEQVVREFLAALKPSDVDELVSFFGDDAVYTDGPRGPYRGVDAIRAKLNRKCNSFQATRSRSKISLRLAAPSWLSGQTRLKLKASHSTWRLSAYSRLMTLVGSSAFAITTTSTP
jgi:ketosteroid isomerase-like protein